ncbi:EamA-like transporter family protein [Hydrogenispora ethanolica]|jgi:drug/metabolite transporter (DMT)-like permease|uniref:EamA-like transporter family protein n=1 Tax=Hydrogenispora ethanolica TaxID=1082276 RepID=A0A4R1RFU3_HYDET|nr:EamA family transporter [Hydrogenispora ethanolica]TCL64796.1 EamA-like transporter family protein [Hydrogenispora ethanolica]
MSLWVIQIIISIALGVAGQLLFKEGAARLDVSLSGAAGVFPLLWRMFAEPLIFIGLVCYGVSTVFWILVLKQKNLSMVYPLIASSYILVVFFSWLFRHETVAPSRWVGALIITVGVWLIARG